MCKARWPPEMGKAFGTLCPRGFCPPDIPPHIGYKHGLKEDVSKEGAFRRRLYTYAMWGRGTSNLRGTESHTTPEPRSILTCLNLIDWFIDWLIDWLIGWLVDWLIDWSCKACLVNSRTCQPQDIIVLICSPPPYLRTGLRNFHLER